MKALLLALPLLFASLAQATQITIKLNLASQAKEVLVAGEFNGWQGAPMREEPKGHWSIQLEIVPGEYGYKFIVDDEWIFDPTNDARKVVDGSPNSLLVVRASDTPAAPQVEGRKTDPPSPTATVPSTTDPNDSPFNRLLPPGEKHVYTLPMTHRLRYVLGKGSFDPKKQSENMTVAIAFPADFDPSSEDNKIAIISQTADADASSVEAMNLYHPKATDNGWVCIAVDVAGDESKRKEWNGMDHRYLLVYSALTDMHKVWPESKKWKYAALGFSGGSGYTNYIGARLAKARYNLVGIWNGGSGYTDSHFSASFTPPSSFYRAKYFLSRGISDSIATEEITEKARRWGDAKFRKFRFETYDGGHNPYKPHIHEAFEWFAED